jgi:GT2 family glycosyltransferase
MAARVAIPELTLAVATRNRPRQLRRCLQALDLQRGELASAEIVVVDDGSTAEADVAAAVASVPGVRLVRQPPGGVAAARNRAAREARAPLICFTDDDCVPMSGWAVALGAALKAGADVVAGPTVVAAPARPVSTASQLIAGWLIDANAATRRRTGFAPGSNFACRSAVVREIPFDETYGPVGGEDRDWCVRLAQAGIEIVFEPTAIVLHADELTLGRFWAKYVRYGEAAWLFRRRWPGPLASTPKSHLALVRSGFDRGLAVGLLVLLAQAATALGLCRELAADLAARRKTF